MADRLLVFGNEELQKLLKEEFIAVTGDDWYQRRRGDEVGKFFRKMSAQGPREAGKTQQGHYVFTPSGKLLGYDNQRGVKMRLQMMREALKKWKELPEGEWKVEVAKDVKLDRGYQRELPKGAQVVKVYTRRLEEREGRLQSLVEKKAGNLTAVDHLWFRKAEMVELGELIAKGGGEVPEWMAMRMAKYHLRDNTRGEPRRWEKEEVKEWTMKVDGGGKVTGSFLIEDEKSELGYQGELSGEWKLEEGRFVKFELLVIGMHWGHGPYTHPARPGKAALGQVFRLSEGKKVVDRIPPQGIRWEDGYWEAEK